MSTRFEIELALKGKDEGARAAVKGASNEVEGLGQRIKMLRTEARASGEMATERALRDPGRMLETAADLIGGAGTGFQLFAVDIAGKQIAKMGESMAEFRRQLVEGKLDAGEMEERLAEGIPIIGEWVKGFMGVREALSGEKLEIELINKEAKLTDEYFAALGKRAETYRGTIKSLDDETAASAARTAINLERDPTRREVMGIDQKERLQKIKDQEALTKAVDDTKKATAALAEAQKKTIENMEQKLNNMNKGTRTVGDQLHGYRQEVDPEGAARYHQAELDVENARARLQQINAQGSDALQQLRNSSDASQRQHEIEARSERMKAEMSERRTADERLISEARESRRPFRAILLSDRYEGLAEQQKDKVEEALSAAKKQVDLTGSMDNSLRQILTELRDRGGANKVGFVLRY